MPPEDITKRLEKVSAIAEHFDMPRSLVRKHIVQDTCPCGGQGANPCWRMGGEAACASVLPAPYDGRTVA